MKKFAYLGLTALLASNVLGGCSNSNSQSVTVVSQDTVVTAEVEPTSSEGEENKVLLLEDKDFEPFFKALFSFSEDQYDSLNQNPLATSVGYFDNLKTYREDMKKTLGKYLTEATLELLNTQNTKLDFDLPKKAQINDYVVEAKGEVCDVSIQAVRKLGEEYVYEIDVTTSNHVMPYNSFFEKYGWSDTIGYYQERELGTDYSYFDASKHSEEVGYTFPNNENVIDAIKIKSTYWVYLVPEETFTSFKVNTVKQGGAFEVDYEVKQKIDNTAYIDRVPYYEEVAAGEETLIKKVVKALMTQPQESYYYYDKVYNESYELFATYWKDLGISNEVAVNEETYKQAFATSINPYKNQDSKLVYDEAKIKIAPSIYGTQLQPAFIVTIPMSVLEKDNEQKYFEYKYYIELEDGKVEAIKYLKRDSITQEAYEAGAIAEGEEEQQEQTSEVAQA